MRSPRALLTCSWLIHGVVAGAVPSQAPGLTLASLLGNSSDHWSSQTVVSFPGSSAFYNSTERWDIYAPPSYAAAVAPATEADVVEAVAHVSPRREHEFGELTLPR